MRPAVLITDADERSMLAVCRGLHQGGYRVVASGRSRAAVALWSRHCAVRALHPDPSRDAPRFVEWTAATASRHGCALVLNGTDPSLAVLSRGRDRLPASARLAVPDDDAVRRAFDKRVLIEAGQAAGFEVPESRICETAEEAVSAAAGMGWPVLLKPLSSAWERDGRVERRNTMIVSGRGRLPAHELPAIVQRHVPGRVLSIGGVLHEGRLIAHAASRYERTWPAAAGSACFSETILTPASVVAGCAELLTSIGWSGLFEIEMVERDGSPLLIDLNPRPYGSLALAIGAGANLPAILCDALTGIAVPDRAIVARAGVRYRWEDADMRHALWQLRSRRPREALREIRPHRSVVHAHLASSDPAPLAARAAQLALVAGRRAAARGR